MREASQWLDAHVNLLKKRPFGELAKLPRSARLESPPHLKGFRFTVSREQAEEEGGVRINVRCTGPQGRWEFREFEKYPNESHDATTMPKLHSMADIARDIGRFECHLDSVKVELHRRPSEMSLAAFKKLGFHRAADIHAFASVYEHDPKDLTPSELRRLGREHAGGWRLDVPRPETQALWDKLLDTAMPMVLQAPEEASWLSSCISRLHDPAVFVDTCRITAEDLKFIRRAIASNDDVVLLAVGLYRDTVSFCGRGPLFEAALSAALVNTRCEKRDFTEFQRSEYRKLALRVLPRKRR